MASMVVNKHALVTILPTRTVLPSSKSAPSIAFFSSRGPAVYGNEKFIKPDIAAPRLDILAAWPSINDTSPGYGTTILQRNSWARPWLARIAAIVKSMHPTWSPSAIKSAIMTAAMQKKKNNRHAPITVDAGSRASPYDFGSGEINLFGPLRTGLVYETKTTDFVQFLCSLGYDASVIRTIASTVSNNFSCPTNSSSHLISNMNYPSMSVSGLKANVTRSVPRTVTNVVEVYSTYTATVEAPAGLQVQVGPNKLKFSKKFKIRTFQVTFKLTTTFSSKDLFGSFTWCNRKQKVQSPLALHEGET